jgi:hypothetical protein
MTGTLLIGFATLIYNIHIDEFIFVADFHTDSTVNTIPTYLLPSTYIGKHWRNIRVSPIGNPILAIRTC